MKRINDFKIVVLYLLIIRVFLLNAYSQNNTNIGGVKLVNSTISQQDTTICKGGKVLLSAYPTFDRSKFTYKGNYNGKNYYLSNDATDWVDAKKNCENAGGYLICIDDKKENDFLDSIVPKDIPVSIGLWQNKNNPEYSEPLGGWEWVNNQPFVFSLWWESEPNNYNNNQDFAIFKSGKWDDAHPFLRYVLEANKINYKWSTGDTTATIIVAPDKTTTYFFETNDGITVSKDSITVYVSNAIFNPLTDSLNSCGVNKLLDAGTGFKTYSWNDGTSTQTLMAKSSGKYSVTVTTNEGCPASDSIYVKLVNAKIIQRDSSICIGGKVFLTADTSFNGTSKVTYKWSTGDTTFSINVSPQKTTKYVLEVTDGTTLCKDSITINVFNPSFNPLLDSLSLCGVTKLLDAGTGFKTYGWNDGSNAQTLLAKASGKYTITVITNDGCSVSDSTFLRLVNSKIKQRDTSICQGGKVLLAADTSINRTFFTYKGNALVTNKVTYKWSTGDTTFSINVSPQITTKYVLEATDGITLCKDSITINVFNTSFNPLLDSLSLCGVTKLLDAGTGFKTYGWNDGTTAQTLLAKASGKYTITVITNDGCSVSDSTFLRLVNSKIKQRDTSICQGGKVLLAADTSINRTFFTYKGNALVTNKVTYKWSTGDTTFSINVSPQKTTKYILEATDGITLCKDSISILVNQIDTSLVSLDPILPCNNTISVRLKAGVASSYKWLKDNTPINNATSNIYQVTTPGIYRVVVTNSTGCSDTSRAINFELNAKPIANFNLNSSSQCLLNNTFITTNTSSLASGKVSYNWNFGNGNSSTLDSPPIIYNASGIYTIKLIAISDKSCMDSISKTITVLAQPSIPTIIGNSGYCTGNSITLLTNGEQSLQWYKDNVLLNGQTSATLTVNQIGDYTVVSKNEIGCQSTSAIKSIVENATPIGTINTPTNTVICEGSSTQLVATGGSSYQWFFNNNPITGGISGTYFATQPGVFSADIISNKGCVSRSTNSITLTVIQKPLANFVYASSCTNIPINLTNTSIVSNSGPIQYKWDLGNGITSIGQSLNYTFSSPLTTNAKLVVTPLSCPQLADSIIRKIIVENSPIGIKYPTANAIENKPLQLQARTFGIKYWWTPSIYLSSATSAAPLYNGIKEQLYKISITNQAGCTTIDTQLVRIFKNKEIYVPTGFSPDNDGHNDKLYPITVGIKQMNVFKVFNRWGIMVYNNKSADATTGWDGFYINMPQPMDTYSWIAQGLDDDGNLISKTGHVILIR